MKLEAKAQTRLRELMQNGALPASQCGRAFLTLLAPLIEGEVLHWKRSGAGQQLSVADPRALLEFCRQRFPEIHLPPTAESRVVGVGRFRDSKAMANTANEIISFRAWRESALLKCGQPAGAAAATAAHGVFSFLLTPDHPYSLQGRCMLVENPVLFAAAEQLNLNVDAVIYGHGRISSRVLTWLCDSDPSFRLLHLPDYDPVGLSEFQRLHSILGPRVELYLAPDLDSRFERFSNRDLLKKLNSQAMLAQLRRSELPCVRRVVELIDRHNAGLEQEALLIDVASSPRT
jgi:hypothetical protein